LLENNFTSRISLSVLVVLGYIHISYSWLSPYLIMFVGILDVVVESSATFSGLPVSCITHLLVDGTQERTCN
jgi:hypothetical protein